MKLQSHEIAKIALRIYETITSLKSRFEIYIDEERNKFGGSNFILEVDENALELLPKINTDLLSRKNIFIDNTTVLGLYELFKTFNAETNKFDNEIEEIRQSQKGSIGAPYFYLAYSQYLSKMIIQINQIYTDILELIEIKEILTNKKLYETLRGELVNRADNFTKLFNDVEEKSSNLTLKLEQVIAEKSVQDISEFYKDILDKIEKEKFWNRFFYYGTSTIFMGLLIGLFFSIDNIVDTRALIPKAIVTFSFFGILAFLLNDFRKRFNISKHILDELHQKSNVVNIYSSLLSKISDFDPETKKLYHEEILKNIINSLLTLQNHGYLGNEFNSGNINPVYDLLSVFNKSKPNI